MKVRILIVVLIFSLALNAAALVAALASREPQGCPAGPSLAHAEDHALGLSTAQRESFARLDEAYHAQRRAAAARLRALRQELVGLVLADQADPAGSAQALEARLARTCEEQTALQRRLIENLRAKWALLEPGQRPVYRQLIENLAGGCGCVGCAGPCH
jgi:Spy/CpxP family protein refolding chaperone